MLGGGCGTERGGGREEVRKHRELTRELEEGSTRPEERTGRRNRPGGGALGAWGLLTAQNFFFKLSISQLH